jgi:phosphoglycolate phosphatase-like HAD superfamily hydrolase
MAIRQVILDFDGTCTLVEEIEREYMVRYRQLVADEWSPVAAARWVEIEALVREASPGAGWTLGGAPSAPAAADPYILSGEVVAMMVRLGIADAPAVNAGSFYARAYADHPAPWRPEVAGLLAALAAMECRVAFVSNSDEQKVKARVGELGLPAEVAQAVRVIGNAAKFRVAEPARARGAWAERFAALPESAPSSLPRPLYLRRGHYYDALCAVWEDAGTTPEETLVAGDVWELDLALPAALGAAVQLVERRPPYPTYEYERHQARRAGGRARVGGDLTAVLERVSAGRAA